jgi:hypothetical protein
VRAIRERLEGGVEPIEATEPLRLACGHDVAAIDGTGRMYCSACRALAEHVQAAAEDALLVQQRGQLLVGFGLVLDFVEWVSAHVRVVSARRDLPGDLDTGLSVRITNRLPASFLAMIACANWPITVSW